jgi:hypothetical protein
MPTPKQLNLFEFSRRAVGVPAKPAAARVTIADTRRMLHTVQVMQMQPGKSPERLEMLHQFERSCRAEIKLRLRAIEYQRGLEDG